MKRFKNTLIVKNNSLEWEDELEYCPNCGSKNIDIFTPEEDNNDDGDISLNGLYSFICNKCNTKF